LKLRSSREIFTTKISYNFCADKINITSFVLLKETILSAKARLVKSSLKTRRKKIKLLQGRRIITADVTSVLWLRAYAVRIWEEAHINFELATLYLIFRSFLCTRGYEDVTPLD
jgi:hypothetical protein